LHYTNSIIIIIIIIIAATAAALTIQMRWTLHELAKSTYSGCNQVAFFKSQIVLDNMCIFLCITTPLKVPGALSAMTLQQFLTVFCGIWGTNADKMENGQ